MKLKAVKDSIGGYRVAGTNIIWARNNECRCCWYVMDQDTTETIAQMLGSYNDAKYTAFQYAMQEEHYPEMRNA
jgi:hypothetical protein